MYVCMYVYTYIQTRAHTHTNVFMHRCPFTSPLQRALERCRATLQQSPRCSQSRLERYRAPTKASTLVKQRLGLADSSPRWGGHSQTSGLPGRICRVHRLCSTRLPGLLCLRKAKPEPHQDCACFGAPPSRVAAIAYSCCCWSDIRSKPMHGGRHDGLGRLGFGLKFVPAPQLRFSEDVPTGNRSCLLG